MMDLFCMACGKLISNDDNFCRYCGAQTRKLSSDEYEIPNKVHIKLPVGVKEFTISFENISASEIEMQKTYNPMFFDAGEDENAYVIKALQFLMYKDQIDDIELLAFLNIDIENFQNLLQLLINIEVLSEINENGKRKILASKEDVDNIIHLLNTGQI